MFTRVYPLSKNSRRFLRSPQRIFLINQAVVSGIYIRVYCRDKKYPRDIPAAPLGLPRLPCKPTGKIIEMYTRVSISLSQLYRVAFHPSTAFLIFGATHKSQRQVWANPREIPRFLSPRRTAGTQRSSAVFPPHTKRPGRLSPAVRAFPVIPFAVLRRFPGR